MPGCERHATPEPSCTYCNLAVEPAEMGEALAQERAKRAAQQPPAPEAATGCAGGEQRRAAHAPPDGNKWVPRVVRACDVVMRPVSWMIPGRVPFGEITTLEGDPGITKTAAACDLLARHAAGLPMPGETKAAPPGVALIVSAEDAQANTLCPRLELAGADTARVLFWNEDTLPTFPSSARALRRLIEAQGISAMLLDPITAFLDPDLNAHRDADIRSAFAPLRGVAEETGCAIIGIRHLNKQGANTNPLYRGGGSIAWIALARSAFLVAEHPEDPNLRVLAHVKCNLAPHAPSLAYRPEAATVEGVGPNVRIEWMGDVPFQAGDLLRSARDAQQSSSSEAARTPLQGEIVALVAEYLAAGPRPARDVLSWLAEGGFARRTVDGVTAGLVSEGRLRKYPEAKGKPWVWEWLEAKSPQPPTMSSETAALAETADSDPDSAVSAMSVLRNGGGTRGH